MNRKMAALMAALAIIPAMAGCGGKADATSTPTVTVTKEVAASSPAPTTPSATPSPSDPIPRLFGHEVHFTSADESWKVTSVVQKVGHVDVPYEGQVTGIQAKSCVDETTGEGDSAQGLGWWRWTTIEQDGTQHEALNGKVDLSGQKMYPFTQQVAPAAGQCFQGWVLFKGKFDVSHVAQFGLVGWRAA
ncbi:hypothetical protein [Acidipropionibacterium jensenii]|uniref:hypothetical protein n=1 Tax=Acidipropionibacterium jensenii TaxID=1749 RepID=UPI000FDBF3A8|nr:hypothetical protein [Acidipropionibacterium jensenii]